ncbi:MAG: phage DNA packaging protein J [Gemmatimonadetes bacterium]|nr:phage DNA packaging protein J [Gemmatimonadota bacterium]
MASGFPAFFLPGTARSSNPLPSASDRWRGYERGRRPRGAQRRFDKASGARPGSPAPLRTTKPGAPDRLESEGRRPEAAESRARGAPQALRIPQRGAAARRFERARVSAAVRPSSRPP